MPRFTRGGGEAFVTLSTANRALLYVGSTHCYISTMMLENNGYPRPAALFETIEVGDEIELEESDGRPVRGRVIMPSIRGGWVVFVRKDEPHAIANSKNVVGVRKPPLIVKRAPAGR